MDFAELFVFTKLLTLYMLRLYSTCLGTPEVQTDGCTTKSFSRHVLHTLNPLLHTLGMYCTPSTRTAHSWHVLHTLNPYCTLSACTAHPQLILHTLGMYCTSSTRTTHSRHVLHTLNPYCTLSACTAHPQPYCTLSACTAHPQPLLRTLNPCCTPLACTLGVPQPTGTAHTLQRVPPRL